MRILRAGRQRGAPADRRCVAEVGECCGRMPTGGCDRCGGTGAENVFSRASRLASGADEPDFVGADAIADGSLRTAGGKGRIAHPKTTLRSDGMQ